MSVGSIRIRAHIAPFLGRWSSPRSGAGQRRPLAIEIAAALLELRDDRVRVEGAPVAQHDDVLAVIGDRIGAGRIDDDRAVMALLLLQARMAVIPVGARLADREFVDEGLARPDAGKADSRARRPSGTAAAGRASGSRCPRRGCW